MEIFRKRYGKKAIFVLIMVITATAGYLLYLKIQTPMKKPTPVIKPSSDPDRELPAKKANPQVKMAAQKPERIFYRSIEPIDILAREVDVEKIQKTTANIHSGTVDEQIEAIVLLSKIGTQQQKVSAAV